MKMTFGTCLEKRCTAYRELYNGFGADIEVSYACPTSNLIFIKSSLQAHSVPKKNNDAF